MATSITFVNGKAQIDADPNSRLDYPFDWGDWIKEHDPTDSISAFEFIADPGLTVFAQSQPAPTVVAAWVSVDTGVTIGSKLKLVCRMTTAAGRRDDRTLTLRIKEA